MKNALIKSLVLVGTILLNFMVGNAQKLAWGHESYSIKFELFEGVDISLKKSKSVYVRNLSESFNHNLIPANTYPSNPESKKLSAIFLVPTPDYELVLYKVQFVLKTYNVTTVYAFKHFPNGSFEYLPNIWSQEGTADFDFAWFFYHFKNEVIPQLLGSDNSMYRPFLDFKKACTDPNGKFDIVKATQLLIQADSDSEIRTLFAEEI